MEQATVGRNLVWSVAMLMAAFTLAGVQWAKAEPAQPQPPAKQPVDNASTPADEPAPQDKTPPEPRADAWRDLGPPLVDHPESLQRLDPAKPIWVDQKRGRLVMVGQICQREAPLELFACLKNTKEHEAIVTVDVEAFKAHAGLLAIGAEAGRPVSWNPQYTPAAGSQIEITVFWKDAKGRRQSARAQDWILNTRTKKAMKHPWVFAGSGFWQDEQTGKKYYQAEGGDFICVSNFPSAMLDLPIQSSQANSELLYRPFTERIPPLATPVTLVLRPKPIEKPPKQQQPEVKKPGKEPPRKSADAKPA
ncbi:MAG: hypothetical protein A2V70_18600 [Planctomycetes bacterium RBG_13_63_9]|nr:MAG: hypothetical protein A2V70_18600 [Planctomycetes bacterium RBG_13_63_9]